MNRNSKSLGKMPYLKKVKWCILWSLLCVVLFFLLFSLTDIPLQALLYPTLLCGTFGLLFLFIGFLRFNMKQQWLQRLLGDKGPYSMSLPESSDETEKLYQELLQKAEKEFQTEKEQWEEQQRDMEDYYAAWVHQIKAPIAVMSLLLQQEDTEENQQLKAELFRVEQYAEMALSYVRLGEGMKDLVIAQYPLDEIIRKAVRKYAGQFIRKRIGLIYEGTQEIVLTDEKWLSFILEQLLSNAVKYTVTGSVTITVNEKQQLTVRDTGIGIAREDLPRIFEKGYTGKNGRIDRKSTGIGLYLCKMAADKMGHKLSAESVPGEGSSFRIDLSSYPFQAE